MSGTQPLRQPRKPKDSTLRYSRVLEYGDPQPWKCTFKTKHCLMKTTVTVRAIWKQYTIQFTNGHTLAYNTLAQYLRRAVIFLALVCTLPAMPACLLILISDHSSREVVRWLRSGTCSVCHIITCKSQEGAKANFRNQGWAVNWLALGAGLA